MAGAREFKNIATSIKSSPVKTKLETKTVNASTQTDLSFFKSFEADTGLQEFQLQVAHARQCLDKIDKSLTNIRKNNPGPAFYFFAIVYANQIFQKELPVIKKQLTIFAQEYKHLNGNAVSNINLPLSNLNKICDSFTQNLHEPLPQYTSSQIASFCTHLTTYLNQFDAGLTSVLTLAELRLISQSNKSITPANQ